MTLKPSPWPLLLFAVGLSRTDTAASVTQNLALPAIGANGTSVSWATDAPDAISAGGVVNRQATDWIVTLTATISKGEASDTKEFSITVLAALSDGEAVAADKATLQITFAGSESAAGVLHDLGLPTTGANGTTISWASDMLSTIGASGAVTWPVLSTVVTLTATLSKGAATDTKSFPVTVLAAYSGEDYLNTSPGFGIRYHVTDDSDAFDRYAWAVSQPFLNNQPHGLDFVFTLNRETTGNLDNSLGGSKSWTGTARIMQVSTPDTHAGIKAISS